MKEMKEGKMIVEDCFIIPFGEFAVRVDSKAKHNSFSRNLVYMGCPKFRKDPLMWIVYKIIKRKYNENHNCGIS